MINHCYFNWKWEQWCLFYRKYTQCIRCFAGTYVFVVITRQVCNGAVTIITHICEPFSAYYTMDMCGLLYTYGITLQFATLDTLWRHIYKLIYVSSSYLYIYVSLNEWPQRRPFKHSSITFLKRVPGHIKAIRSH